MHRPTLISIAVLMVIGCNDHKATTEAPPTPGIQAPAPPGIEDFSGDYVSNYGTTVTFTQVGTTVESAVTARHGKITCTATGTTLDCTWTKGNLSGKDKLVKQPDGTIKGTYGNGDSATDGGVLSFTKKTAGSVSPTTKTKSSGATRACPFADQTKCPSGNCENLQVSNGNCGRCGNFCPSGTVCQKGVCAK